VSGRRTPASGSFSWTGVVAVILAITLGGGWSAALVISALLPTTISTEGLTFLDNLGQTLATGVVAFLGYKVGEAAAISRAARPPEVAEEAPTKGES